MTDLEMTKKCAEAMGYSLTEWQKGLMAESHKDGGVVHENYDPLHDDAQVMALVKKFKFSIFFHDDAELWSASDQDDTFSESNTDLNRAIVECVAKML